MIAAAALAVCSWANPGSDPYMGDVVAAVDRYRDIPIAAREALKARMLARRYDDVAEIRRDTIQGVQSYSDLRDMHFGEGRICRAPSRALWSAQHAELGLVYCEQEHCLIVPTVCRNVSRVTRTTAPPVLPPAPPPSILPPVEISGGPGLSQQRLLLADDEFIAPAKPIPEPSTWLLFLLGLAGILFARWLNGRRDETNPLVPRRRKAGACRRV